MDYAEKDCKTVPLQSPQKFPYHDAFSVNISGVL